MTRTMLFLVAFLLSFVSGTHAQTAARLPDGHWSITVPQGWKVADDAMLEKVNQLAAGVNVAGVGKIRYVMMLISTDKPGCYALVQREPPLPPRFSFDGYIKSVTTGIDNGVNAVREAIPDKVASASFDSPVVDRQRRRVYLPGAATTPGGGSIKSLTCPQAGSGDLVTVHCYSPSATFEANKPTLIAIADSFAFDAGYDYAFVEPKEYKFWRLGVAAAVGAVVGLAVWGVRKLMRR